MSDNVNGERHAQWNIQKVKDEKRIDSLCPGNSIHTCAFYYSRMSFEIGAKRSRYHNLDIVCTPSSRIWKWVIDLLLSFVMNNFDHSMVHLEYFEMLNAASALVGTIWMWDIADMSHHSSLLDVAASVCYWKQSRHNSMLIGYFRCIGRTGGSPNSASTRNQCNCDLTEAYDFDEIFCLSFWNRHFNTPRWMHDSYIPFVTRNWHIYDNWMPSQSALAFENVLESLDALSPQTIPSYFSLSSLWHRLHSSPSEIHFFQFTICGKKSAIDNSKDVRKINWYFSVRKKCKNSHVSRSPLNLDEIVTFKDTKINKNMKTFPSLTDLRQ